MTVEKYAEELNIMLRIIKKLIVQKTFSFRCAGNSMAPTIHANDIIYFRKISFSQVKINDIILVVKKTKKFVHRVIYISANRNQKYCITKGDNTLLCDGKIYPRNIYAKVYQLKQNGHIFHIENRYLIQSTLYFQEICQLNKQLLFHHVNYVFLKGLPLHLFFEKTYPLRYYADCDVLIDKKHEKKVERIVKMLGYRKIDSSFSIIHKILKDKPTEYSFYKIVNNFPVIIDVHFEPIFLMNQLGRLDNLYSQQLIDEMTQLFLQCKQIIIIGNNHIPILSPHHLLIYLSLHFFHHNFRGVYKLDLISKIINYYHQNSTIQWDVLAEKIHYFRINRFIYPVFHLLKMYYSVFIPSEFFRGISPRNIDAKTMIRMYGKNLILFNDQKRVEAGIERFINIFQLSNNPFLIKIMVFANLQVLYSFFWVFYQYLASKIQFYFSSARKKNLACLFLLFAIPFCSAFVNMRLSPLH